MTVTVVGGGQIHRPMPPTPSSRSMVAGEYVAGVNSAHRVNLTAASDDPTVGEVEAAAGVHPAAALDGDARILASRGIGMRHNGSGLPGAYTSSSSLPAPPNFCGRDSTANRVPSVPIGVPA